MARHQYLGLDADRLAGALKRHTISPTIGVETKDAATRVRELRPRLETSDDHDIVGGVAGTSNMDHGSIRRGG
jgi:hypothetical protein